MADRLRRRQYLEAMGIQTWSLRASARAVVAPPPSERVVAGGAELEVNRSVPAVQGEASSATRRLQAQPRSAPGAAGAVSVATPAAVGPAPTHPAGKAPVAQLEWAALEAGVASCRACGLHQTRTQAVFGVGDRNANLLVIGEAPGADEDRQGEPFVGRAGQLLNAMLFAMGFRREQVFIANILKCRPPGNRDPRAEEAAHCEPFLLRQVELVRPKVILAVGRISAQNLLRSSDTVGRLRGRVHAFGSRGIPVVVTYHPAYLLRSPDQKPKAWQDLQRVMQLLGAGSTAC